MRSLMAFYFLCHKCLYSVPFGTAGHPFGRVRTLSGKWRSRSLLAFLGQGRWSLNLGPICFSKQSSRPQDHFEPYRPRCTPLKPKPIQASTTGNRHHSRWYNYMTWQVPMRSAKRSALWCFTHTLTIVSGRELLFAGVVQRISSS